MCKKVLRNHSIHCNNNSTIILFTENFKQLFFVLILVKKTCCRWVSNRHIIPTKHKLTIKPWYFRIQQNWAIILQVYVTHFEYWLLSKSCHLTGRQNKSRPGGGNIFFPVKLENNGNTISTWTAPKSLTFEIGIRDHHHLISTMLKSKYDRMPPKTII